MPPLPQSNLLNIAKGYAPIDSLTVTLRGESSAQINFMMKARLLLWDDVETILQENLGINLSPSQMKSSPMPVALNKMSVPAPVAAPWLDALFQVETVLVHISGSFLMSTDSDIPITAQVFANSVLINRQGVQMKAYDLQAPVLGFVNQANQTIQPITGAILQMVKIPGA